MDKLYKVISEETFLQNKYQFITQQKDIDNIKYYLDKYMRVNIEYCMFDKMVLLSLKDYSICVGVTDDEWFYKRTG